MDEKFAKSFASEWVEAWNAHDIERVLSHCTDDFEMCSPIIAQLLGEPSGSLRGKLAVSAYWRKALQAVPDLQFELISVLVSVRSLVIYYKGAKGRLSAEVFDLNSAGQIVKAVAHYAN
jgi:predicted ester cyclase